MDTVSPGDQYSPEPNVLERRAAALIARRARDLRERQAGAQTPVARQVARIQRWSIALAAASGVVSGGLIGAVEIVVRQDLLGGMEDHIGLREQLPYWVGFFVFAGLVSAVEIVFLYGLALEAARRIYCLAGVPADKAHAQLVERSLARAALEFPNPGERVYGLDPYAHVPRWRVTARNLMYRLKVGVSSFLMRLFLRRVVGRILVRSVVPLLSGPLYAAWNAIIVWRIVRELHIRAFGAAAIGRLAERLRQTPAALDARARAIVVEGIGELMLRSQDAHPNYVLLLCALRESFGSEDASIEIDWPRRREDFSNIAHDQRASALAVLTFAAAVCTRATRSQKQFLQEAYEDAGERFDPGRLKALRAALLDGEDVASDLVR
jgi:hypothetical protein